MKMIKCFIKHANLEEVRDKLFQLGVPGLSTIVETSIVLENEAVDEVVDMVVKTAHTGNLSDEIFFVLPVEDVIRIRTSERATQALY
jgi:nitrogen regulatory protein PII